MLYHSHIHKSAEEDAQQQEEIIERERLKAERRREQVTHQYEASGKIMRDFFPSVQPLLAIAARTAGAFLRIARAVTSFRPVLEVIPECH